MNDDLTSNPANYSDDALARALEEIISERAFRGGVSQPDDASMPLEGVCPEPGEWLRILSGEARPAEADALLAHATACRVCAARLRMLSADASQEETAEVGKLASISCEWQHKLAVELARTSNRPAGKRAAWLYLWVGAGLAASLVIAAALTIWWQRVNTPERLLAEAYTHSRIFDLRMAGAGFAEVTPQTHLRGNSTGRESSQLLDARAHIERQLESAPENSHWLQLEARAYLLEEKFDPAIDILDRLLAAGPVTSDLLVDDAAAYYQRGVATGSENDRATALDSLRRADELAPGDPLVLFNEAIVMEDRGQVMNAVETWNRYLRFERDSRWQAEGRRRLEALEQKLNQLKTHHSRMEQYLATPQAIRALAENSVTLAAIDEELSSTLLPKLLRDGFPVLAARSRGSPCAEDCQAARTLLHALAASLERTHRDPWLTQLLFPTSSSLGSSQINRIFLQATQALAQAIDSDVRGNYLAAQQMALQASQLFHKLDNAAGEDRAEVERAFALQRSNDLVGCYRAAHPLLGRNPQFVWIQIHDLTEDTQCDSSPGTALENNPFFLRAVSLAHDSHYALLELRARNLLGAAAVDAGNTEAAWRVYLPTVRRFYGGDYPAYRLYTTLSGLEELEQATPRIHLTYLLQREVVGVLELTEARELIPTERFKLATVAIRVGALSEGQEQMRIAESELAAFGGGKSVRGYMVENAIAMANLYLDRQNLGAAAKMLDAAYDHMAGERNTYTRRDYAVARGQLELTQGHPEAAESMLRDAVIEEERLAGKARAEGIARAQQDRALYAVLAGVWLAQGRSGEEVLALWERYRLRILGEPVSACANNGLACLKPRLTGALARLGQDHVLGQIVLLDRLLLYRANTQGVAWTSVPMRKEDLLAAAAPLERAVSSPATPLDSVDRAARRVGGFLLVQLDGVDKSATASGQLLLESDPLLGNLPWPSVATEAGPIGLRFSLVEAPSILLDRRPALSGASTAKPLIVGASAAAGETELLPEALNEARAVARFGNAPNLLLADQATHAQVAARLTTASAIHFAGHAAEQDGAMRLLLASAKTAPTDRRTAGMVTDKPYLDSALFRRHPPRAARLAVLSACSTGKREESWNHGMGDIVDTLASLGVPDVVATRWQIDSTSAVPMMDAFYGGLARGLSVPQALTAARQSLIRDVRYRHPYYWAAYYASGWGN
jgi:tetratricopeptide (TPR) repeat protein